MSYPLTRKELAAFPHVEVIPNVATNAVRIRVTWSGPRKASKRRCVEVCYTQDTTVSALADALIDLGASLIAELKIEYRKKR